MGQLQLKFAKGKHSTIPGNRSRDPPRSEFLQYWGQKNGRNLEAPESLIRQIVREETGGKQGNNTYNVSVSASGRNLLDIVLEEGELRRNRNGGRNPFKLDD